MAGCGKPRVTSSGYCGKCHNEQSTGGFGATLGGFLSSAATMGKIAVAKAAASTGAGAAADEAAIREKSGMKWVGDEVCNLFILQST